MLIIDRPPPSEHFVVGAISCRGGRSSLGPWLVAADEVDQVDARLEMSICRDVRVVSGRSHVVCEAEAVV